MSLRGGVITAVLFSVLMISSNVGIAATVGNAGYPAVDRDDDSIERIGTGNQSAAEMKGEALVRIREISHALNDSSDLTERPIELVSGTLDDYRGPDRATNESVFRNDSKAIGLLSDLEQANPSRVDESTWLIAKADARTANASLTDAQRAFEYFQADIDNPGQRQKVTRKLDNAERAYERGIDALETDNTSVNAAARDRARAVRQFATAWRHSQAALDVLADHATPRLSIASRMDAPPSELNRTKRKIVGQVLAVRPYTVDTVTVQVEDRDPVKVETTDIGAPATNAVFRANVTYLEEPHGVTAWVTDVEPDAEKAGNGPPADKSGNGPPADKSGNGPPADKPGNGPPGDRPGDESGDRTQPDQPHADTVLFDGDGLPDTYEMNVTGTNPLDPDSDFPETSADESDDGVLDGYEDPDGDGLETMMEAPLDTDPFDADTDGDGLSDGVETRQGSVSPTDSDTDDDGVTDSEEDSDGDGLTNAAEADLGTSFTSVDTDDDGLEDPREPDIGTNATVADTDDDGLPDGEELGLPTNPLDPDTDDDGVLDGNETFTTKTGNESLGVSLELTGQGNVAAGTTVEPEQTEWLTGERVTNSSVSEVVHLDAEREFDRANVTIEYDESAVEGDPEDTLAVFTYNESLQLYEPLNSTVDPDSNTVTAETSHFSTFAVFDVRNWASEFTAEEPDRRGGGGGNDSDGVTPLDITFVMDSSSSMSGNDPKGFRKQAAKRFVGALIDGDRAALVDFDNYAHVSQGLTTNFAAVNSSIDRLDQNGGTNIGAGLSTANQHIADESNDSRANVVILLTDGEGGGGRAQAETAAERGTTIYTIGFGDVNENKLIDIANETGGEYHYVEDPADLPDVFSRVADETAATQDSDGDGLPDSLEREGIDLGLTYSTHGSELNVDPHDPDTDGDGLLDGEEVGERVEVEVNLGYNNTLTGSAYRLTSHPEFADSDGDGLSDYEEVEVLPDVEPRDPDTDHDGLDDSEDPEPTQRQPYEGHAWERSFVENDDGGLKVVDRAAYGAVLGDVGVQYPGLTESALSAFQREDAESMAYVAGWITLAIVPGIDVLADVRDCAVLEGSYWDALDCLAAGVSIITSGSTLVSLISSPIGGPVSLLLGAGSTAISAVEGVARAGVIIAKAVSKGLVELSRIVKWVLVKLDVAAEEIGRVVSTNLDDAADIDVVRRLADRYEPYTSLTARGFSGDQAARLQKVVKQTDLSADDVERIRDSVDDFDSLDIGRQVSLVRQLGQQSDDAVEAARRLDELDADALETIVKTGRTSEALRLVDEVDGASRVMDDLRRIDEDALYRFLSMEESIKAANDIDEVRKSAEELAHQVRSGIVRSVDNTDMTAQTADRFSRGVHDMASADVENFARHLDQRIARNSGAAGGRFNYNNIKGAANEIIIGREIFGVDTVRGIGISPSSLSGDADLVLTDGRVVEVKAATTGIGSQADITRQLNEIKAVQDELVDGSQADQPVVWLVNNPGSIYRSGSGGDLLPKVEGARDSVSYRAIFEASSERAPDGTIVRFITF